MAAGGRRKTGSARRPGRPRGGGEENAGDRRAILAEAALDLFSGAGFDRVAIKDVARRADCDPALIYYYFAGKEGLFQAAVAHAVETAYASFRRLEGARDDPVHTISAWLDTQERPQSPIPKMARMGLHHRMAGVRIAGVDEAIGRFYDEERRLLERAVRAGLARGLFRDVAPRAFARFVSTFLDGIMVRQVMLDEDAKAAVDRFRAEVWRRLGMAETPRRRKFIED